MIYPPLAPGASIGPHAAKRISHRVIAWEPIAGYVYAQIVLEVLNIGSETIELLPFNSDFTLFAPDGSVTDTGTFDRSLPRWLPPGETGYLVGTYLSDEVEVQDIESAEVNMYFAIPDDPVINLTPSGVKVRAKDDGVAVTGLVTNETRTDVERAFAGAVLFDAQGRILGAVSDVGIENLAAGQRKGFSADGSPPMDVDDVHEVLVFASSYD